MATKAASAILTLLISLGLATIGLFIMMVAMNGYHESDATWGLCAFVVFAIVITAGTASGAFVISGLLLRRGMKPLLSVLLAVPAGSLAACVMLIVAALIGIGIAELVRSN